LVFFRGKIIELILKYNNKQLRAQFLNRIKSWDRIFKTLDFVYLPKVYQKNASLNPLAYQRINHLHSQLLDKIYINLDNREKILFNQIEYIQVIKNDVYVKCYRSNRIKIEDFKVNKNNKNQISIDHKIALDTIVTNRINQLPELINISKMVSGENGCVNKDQLKDCISIFNKNIDQFNINTDKMLDELELIYNDCELHLMPLHTNIAKGKK